MFIPAIVTGYKKYDKIFTSWFIIKNTECLSGLLALFIVSARSFNQITGEIQSMQAKQEIIKSKQEQLQKNTMVTNEPVVTADLKVPYAPKGRPI